MTMLRLRIRPSRYTRKTTLPVSHAPLWSVALSFLILLGLSAKPIRAETRVFEGRIAAVEQAQVYSRIEGRVAAVRAVEGEFVQQGDLLVMLEDQAATLAVTAAQLDVQRAQTVLRQARDNQRRAARLAQTRAGSDVALFDAGIALSLAETELRAAEIALAQAELNLGHTQITAPITGYVSNLTASTGALLEFDAGVAPLMSIVNLDQMRVLYDVPYRVRLATKDASDQATSDALLAGIRLDLALLDGTALATDIQPHATSITVDPNTNTLTVWADIANPDALLRPGLAVMVTSTRQSGALSQ